MDCVLAKRIIKRHPKQFLGAIIYGERGNGKSMYAYLVMAKIYFELFNLSEKEAYKMALDHMIFNAEDLIKLISKNITEDTVTPVLCLDDATVHFCSYKYFTNREEVVILHGIFDTIRTAATGLLMTCPKLKKLLSFLREYDDLKIEIKRADTEWRRYARAYRWNWLPDQKKFNIRVPFQDNYSCYIKNEFYKPYIEKRKAVLKDMNEEMMKYLNIDDGNNGGV